MSYKGNKNRLMSEYSSKRSEKVRIPEEIMEAEAKRTITIRGWRIIPSSCLGINDKQFMNEIITKEEKQISEIHCVETYILF